MSESAALRVEGLVDLISAAETARILGVHRATICRWVERGRLPGLKVGDGHNGFFVFDRSDVLAFQRRRVERLQAVHREVMA